MIKLHMLIEDEDERILFKNEGGFFPPIELDNPNLILFSGVSSIVTSKIEEFCNNNDLEFISLSKITNSMIENSVFKNKYLWFHVKVKNTKSDSFLYFSKADFKNVLIRTIYPDTNSLISMVEEIKRSRLPTYKPIKGFIDKRKLYSIELSIHLLDSLINSNIIEDNNEDELEID